MITRQIFDPDCRDCPRLAGFLDQVKQQHPDYHARPVAPFGDQDPFLLIVGLAPGKHGANATGRPFTGDYAGVWLYQALFDFRFSNRAKSVAQQDGLALNGCRITNAVKCLPPQNKPNSGEINQCNHFLGEEINALRNNAVILALGGIAHAAVLKTYRLAPGRVPFAHNRTYQLPDGKTLVSSYHCSRYNIQTKRLTKTMFDDVFHTVTAILG